MEERYGREHGAYIWGRSVHNIHIERFSGAINFFLSLEYSNGLQPDLDAHIWLLHHLFLAAINQDAADWARTWNEHKLRFDSERTRSPRDMFFFGMIENEVLDDDDIDDLNAYGVDWEDLNNTDIMAHHTASNADQELSMADIENPFSNDGPHTSLHVEVLEPLCPFSEDQVDRLNQPLALSQHSLSRNMNSRRAVWIEVLDFCRNLYENN
ncbi:hypothetical protein DFH09DRAFT_1248985 [Mycena vulgaris]|nr:hypothetical protein DFH09DRAFT_1248985 [Mycena vulgaris]